MITKARLTEEGNFQVDKEIIEYPEILSGGRNLIPNSKEEWSMDSKDSNKKWYEVYLTKDILEKGYYTISFEAKSTEPSDAYYVSLAIGDSSKIYFVDRPSSERVTNQWVRYSFVANNTLASITNIIFCNNITYASPTNTGIMSIRDMKLVKNTNTNISYSPAPEDLGLSYPSSIQNFTPSIHDDFILMPEIIESSISDKLQISPTQLKIPNLLIEHSIVPKYAASENLILHYDFKGKRNVDSDRGIVWDHSGNNNNGQLYNFVYNQTTGYDGIGLIFAGSQYIKFGNIIQPETEEVTIDILINITSDATAGGACTLFCCRNKLGEGIAIFSFNNGIIRIDNGNNQWSSTYSIQYNTPTKITVIRDSNKRSLYINNQFHSSNNNPGNFDGIGSVTSMGASQINDTGYDNFLNGIIYSTKIYNRALTPEEITHNFQIDKQRFNINI